MTAPLPEQARQARDRLTALLAAHDPDEATRVADVMARQRDQPAVVVVGETKRGKSSLVNALLATPGLSPVDADVCTSTYLVFTHAQQWSARACYPGSLAPVSFDPAELARWVAVGGELPDGRLPPQYVEVAGPVPLLDRVTLVDTPGVGGLDSMHGAAARQAARSATAVLFVVDASAPFTAHELAFLAELAEQVETVLFAVAKTDAFRGWQQVLDADRALLATHAPRFADAPIWPCSARLFELAGTQHPDHASLLRTRSGIGELQSALQDAVVGRSVMLTQANALRTLSTALRGPAEALRSRCRALSSGAQEADALRTRRDELTSARRTQSRGWQVKLRGEVQRARVESSHEVSRAMRDIGSWFRQAVDGADRGRLAGLPGEVDAALRTVTARLSADLATRVARVGQLILADLFTEAERAQLLARLAVGTPPVVLRPPERRAPNAEDRLLVFMGVTGGFGAARVATLPLAGLGAIALNPLVLPATIVVGLGAGWWLARTRRHSADKQHMKQWLTEAIADARSTMDQLVAEQMIDAEQQLALALDDALAKRIDAIDAQLREVDRAMKLADTERARALTQQQRALAEVDAAIETADELLTQIRAVRDRGSVPGHGNQAGLR
jgi:hypothetical protein